jgi:hypothetical protein
MGSPTLQTLQNPIVLLFWVCFPNLREAVSRPVGESSRAWPPHRPREDGAHPTVPWGAAVGSHLVDERLYVGGEAGREVRVVLEHQRVREPPLRHVSDSAATGFNSKATWFGI